MSHDPACFDLAKLFLDDDPELAGEADDLAETIQEAIEDWIFWKREKPARTGAIDGSSTEETA